MTNRLTQWKDAFPRRARPLLVVGLVAGDPYLEATRTYLDLIIDEGADVVDVIVPFSEPAFDGPVVRRACKRALSEHVGWDALLAMIASLRAEHPEIPVVLTSYLNRILARGPDRLAAELAQVGVDGLRVRDLPARESEDLSTIVENQGVSLIQTVAPSTGLEDFRKLERASSGFLIWSGWPGGDQDESNKEIGLWLRELRQYTALPLVVSMSIESGAQAARIAGAANGVVVEAALAWLIEGMGPNVEDRIRAFVADLRTSLDALAG